VECHRTLQRDEVIALWRYDRQDGPWSEWTVLIEPPDNIRRSYEEGPPAVPRFELPPRITQESGKEIRAKRESFGLSQRRLAQELGISQSGLSKAETGTVPTPEALCSWLKFP
jgi:ribosome-binding protein aMBF1 (putative translation factor)